MKLTGYGVVLSVAEEKADTLINAVNDVFGENFDSIEEIYDADLIGEFYPAENIEEIVYAGDAMDPSEGVFIADMNYGSEYANARYTDFGEFMERIGFDYWIDEPQVGNWTMTLSD